MVCAVGVRAHNAARILMQNGFEKVSILEGGMSFYNSQIYERKTRWDNDFRGEADGNFKPGGAAGSSHEEAASVTALDCCGMQCPGPIMKVNEALKELPEGAVLKVSATDLGFSRDVESWCCRTGNTYVGVEKQGKESIVTLMKGVSREAAEAELGKLPAAALEAPQGKTIIVFDGDMDKVMASLIIANGATAMGRPVTMFYTFWGLNALRKGQKVKVNKTLTEKMFGAMMPRGLSRLKLSNMHMLGAGKAMMKSVMAKKNVTSLEELMQQAMANGVKMIACTMSMDVMGIKEEELIDGVELAGVATYLGEAEGANVNLFI